MQLNHAMNKHNLTFKYLQTVNVYDQNIPIYVNIILFTPIAIGIHLAKNLGFTKRYGLNNLKFLFTSHF